MPTYLRDFYHGTSTCKRPSSRKTRLPVSSFPASPCVFSRLPFCLQLISHFLPSRAHRKVFSHGIDRRAATTSARLKDDTIRGLLLFFPLPLVNSSGANTSLRGVKVPEVARVQRQGGCGRENTSPVASLMRRLVKIRSCDSTTRTSVPIGDYTG